MEHSLCRPLLFNQSITNTQSFPLNSSKFDWHITFTECIYIYPQGGDSHMEQTGMLVGNFEFNP